jgi:hypothetical protein
MSRPVDGLVRTFSVTFTLTGDQIADLGRHLKMRQVEASSGMDTVQIEDRVCMAVFKSACANNMLTVSGERKKGQTA